MRRLPIAMQSLALTVALAFAGSASAAALEIINAGFEDPVLADGVETSPYHVPGWVEHEPTWAWQWEAYNPSSELIPVEAHGGQNVVMTLAYDPAIQYLEQQLTDRLELNTRYTLSAWVADPDGHNPQNSTRLLLYAGTTLLGTGTVEPTEADTWAEGSLVYETGNVHPQAGQRLKIRIMVGVNNSYRTLIDDVSLDATAIPPVVALYTWDGSNNNWNSPHWNPGVVTWPGPGNDASVTNGTVNIPDANGAFQVGTLAIAGGTVRVTGADGCAGVSATLLGPGGTLIISGVSSRLGALTLAGGTLAASTPPPKGSWQLGADVNAIGDGVTSTISAPQVALGDSARNFAVAGGATLEVSGTLGVAGAGEGLVKNGTGTLILAGANVYEGSTLVNAGRLVVNNTTGSGTGSGDVTIATGSTLTGSGRIAGPVTVQTGATLAPGNSIGTLTINNSLMLSGNTLMEVRKTGGVITNDLVRGMTDLTYGGTLFVNSLGDPLAVGDAIQLFDAANYDGFFASLSPGKPGPGMEWDTSELAHGLLRVAAEVVFGSVPIVNSGFEDPVLLDGKENGDTGFTVPGWVEFDEQHPWSWDIANPNAGVIASEAHGGQNVLLSLGYLPGTQYVEQELAEKLESDTRYTLTAWVADPDDKGAFINNVKLMLFAGANPVGEAMLEPSVVDTWTQGALVYESGPSHPDAGQPLRIRIMWGTRASYRVMVDDVSLTAVPLYPCLWNIKPRADGNMVFTATGEPNQTYSLVSTTNLALPVASWTTVTSGTVTESPFTLTDPTATSSKLRFYTLKSP